MLNVLTKYLRHRYHRIKLHTIISSVIQESLTYLDYSALQHLAEQITKIETEGIKGIIIETGCALGGSSIILAAGKAKSRPLHIYDVFDMIPPPTEEDGNDVHNRYEIIKSGESTGIAGHKYYGYEENLHDIVIANLDRYGHSTEPNNIFLIKGLFQNTLHIDQPVALAHIDCDWYKSVFTCLERIEPHLVDGGVLVIDDYYAWTGCRKAVDEYFIDKQSNYKFVNKSRLHIIRK